MVFGFERFANKMVLMLTNLRDINYSIGFLKCFSFLNMFFLEREREWKRGWGEERNIDRLSPSQTPPETVILLVHRMALNHLATPARAEVSLKT